MTDEERHDAACALALKLAAICDKQEATVVLAAMATIAGQSVVTVACANDVAPLDVINVFRDDVLEWTGKFIAFQIQENVLAPAEKAATNPTEH